MIPECLSGHASPRHIPKASPCPIAYDNSKTRNHTHLYGLQDGLLELSLNLLSLLVGVGLAVEVKKGSEVELWCLEELDLADVNLV